MKVPCAPAHGLLCVLYRIVQPVSTAGSSDARCECGGKTLLLKGSGIGEGSVARVMLQEILFLFYFQKGYLSFKNYRLRTTNYKINIKYA